MELAPLLDKRRVGVDRFWPRVEVGTPEECWEWKGPTYKGYGRIGVEGRVDWTHRIAFVLAGGVLEQGQHVHHKCENRACCNPGHLQALGSAEHSRVHRPGPMTCPCGREKVARGTAYGATRYVCPPCERERQQIRRAREYDRLVAGSE